MREIAYILQLGMVKFRLNYFLLSLSFVNYSFVVYFLIMVTEYRGMHPLRSLVTSVLGHFGPRTDLHVHFGPRSLRSSVTSVLRTEMTEPDRSLAKSDRSSGNTQLEVSDS